MIYLGVVTGIVMTRSLATHDEYRVGLSSANGTMSVYTRNAEVLKLEVGVKLYITSGGTFVRSL